MYKYDFFLLSHTSIEMCCIAWKRFHIFTNFVEVKKPWPKTLILDLLLFCSILRNFAMKNEH